MRKFYLIRTKTGNAGSEGFISDGEFTCKSLELAWRNNQIGISCIPTGTYTCQIRKSNRFGIKYHLQKVPNRTFILIHSGNWAGDVSMGFRSDVRGCILLGKEFGFLYKQRAILKSRETVQEFMSYNNHKNFELTIIKGE